MEFKKNIKKMVHINILNSPKTYRKTFSPLVTKIKATKKESAKNPWKNVSICPKQILDTTVFTKA